MSNVKEALEPFVAMLNGLENWLSFRGCEIRSDNAVRIADLQTLATRAREALSRLPAHGGVEEDEPCPQCDDSGYISPTMEVCDCPCGQDVWRERDAKPATPVSSQSDDQLLRELAASFAHDARDAERPDVWNEACDHIANGFRHEVNPFGRVAAQSDDQVVAEQWHLQFSNTPPSVTIWSALPGRESRRSVAYVEFADRDQKARFAGEFYAIKDEHNASLSTQPVAAPGPDLRTSEAGPPPTDCLIPRELSDVDRQL